MEKIIYILEGRLRAMSIKEIKERLEYDYDINRSPQVIKRYLLYLKGKGKIE
ncbi:MAG TPA: hypothetical protein VMZ91_04210 [Candidatus Paceibacterota bacterium]|nr:hypothetical protein [Candidatus Paceibacterota bacterium]